MTFTTAINSCRNGEAVKRETWTSYIRNEVPEGTTGDTSKTGFVLTFVRRDGETSTYAFGVDGHPENPMMLSHELLEGMLNDDWIRGNAESFEKARTAVTDF